MKKSTLIGLSLLSVFSLNGCANNINSKQKSEFTTSNKNNNVVMENKDKSRYQYYEIQDGIQDATLYTASSTSGAKISDFRTTIKGLWSYQCIKSNTNGSVKTLFKMKFPQAVATPNDKLTVKIRFKNSKTESSKLYELHAKMYSDSYESAYIDEFDSDFVNDTMHYKGIIFTVINSVGTSSGQYYVSNRGFKNIYNNVMEHCR